MLHISFRHNFILWPASLTWKLSPVKRLKHISRSSTIQDYWLADLSVQIAKKIYIIIEKCRWHFRIFSIPTFFILYSFPFPSSSLPFFKTTIPTPYLSRNKKYEVKYLRIVTAIMAKQYLSRESVAHSLDLVFFYSTQTFNFWLEATYMHFLFCSETLRDLIKSFSAKVTNLKDRSFDTVLLHHRV